MDFDTLTKHCLVKRKKNAAMLSVFVKEFEKGFKIEKKKLSNFWYINNSVFS